MGKRQLVGGVLVVLLFLTGACADGGTETAAEAEAEDEFPADRSREFEGDVSIEVGGDFQANWSGRSGMTLTRLSGEEVQISVFSLGMAKLVPYTDDVHQGVRWAFDMLNAFNDEPGEFRIDSSPQGGGFQNAAMVAYAHTPTVPVQEAVEEEHYAVYREYRKILQPCVLRVLEADGGAGELECPALGSDDGKTVSLRATWREL